MRELYSGKPKVQCYPFHMKGHCFREKNRHVLYILLHVISNVISCREQDCVVVLAPYPNNPNPVESFNVKTDFDLTGNGLVWYARAQLFFNCTLSPTGDKGSAYSGLHKEVSLVYFSTFEPID
jgi:hypothetical protein